MLSNKHAQIGETMTWVGATVAIIIILIFSLFISVKMGESKKIVQGVKGIFTGEYELTQNLLESKSVFAYFLIENEEQKQLLYDKVQGKDKFNKINLIVGLENE